MPLIVSFSRFMKRDIYQRLSYPSCRNYINKIFLIMVPCELTYPCILPEKYNGLVTSMCIHLRLNNESDTTSTISASPSQALGKMSMWHTKTFVVTQCISRTSQKRQVRRTHSLPTPIFIFLSTSVLRLSPHRFSPSLKNTSPLLMVLNFFVPLSSFPSQGGASRKVFSLLPSDSDTSCLMRHAVWDFEGQTSLNIPRTKNRNPPRGLQFG